MSGVSQSRILRASELTERLGISRVTLWRWERKGRIPAKRQIGPNTIGWLAAEIDAWFESTSTKHQDEREPTR